MIDANQDIDTLLQRQGITYPIGPEDRKAVSKQRKRLKRKELQRGLLHNLIAGIAAFVLGAFLFGSPLLLRIYAGAWAFLEDISRIVALWVV